MKHTYKRKTKPKQAVHRYHISDAPYTNTIEMFRSFKQNKI